MDKQREHALGAEEIERRKEADRKLAEERAKQLIADSEKRKQEDLRREEEKRDLARLETAIALEQKRSALATIAARYPGIKLDPSLAQCKDDEFVQRIGAALQAFQRLVELNKDGDYKQINFLNRALRHIEVPKRKALAKSLEAASRQAQLMRNKNFLEQHETMHRESLELKNRLFHFYPQREEYERAAVQRVKAQLPKPTKRDEQEDMLRREKELREAKELAKATQAKADQEKAVQEKTAAPDVSATKKPPAPTAAPAQSQAPPSGAPAAAAPASSGKWQSKRVTTVGKAP